MCIACVCKGFLWCQRVSECQSHEYESLFAYISLVFGSKMVRVFGNSRWFATVIFNKEIPAILPSEMNQTHLELVSVTLNWVSLGIIWYTMYTILWTWFNSFRISSPLDWSVVTLTNWWTCLSNTPHRLTTSTRNQRGNSGNKQQVSYNMLQCF